MEQHADRLRRIAALCGALDRALTESLELQDAARVLQDREDPLLAWLKKRHALRAARRGASLHVPPSDASDRCYGVST